MQTKHVACSVAFVACSSILTGCGGGGGTPSPNPGGKTTTQIDRSTTTATTTTKETCQPGNSLDQCHIETEQTCHQAECCTVLGAIGCQHSTCIWKEDADVPDGGSCQSPHGTTTTTTFPSGPCEPQTPTDACFARGDYCSDETCCNELGPIGCVGQICQYFNGHCGSRHETTTVGPCVPDTITDKCFAKCYYCTNSTECTQLGPQGCDGATCTWVDVNGTGHCQSPPASLELLELV